MLRLALSPRWYVWHLLTLGAMFTCAWLAAWQWGKAGTAMGSALNVGYGLQWPVFAVFFGYMWWRFLRLEARREAGLDGDETVPAPTDSAPVTGGVAASAAAAASATEAAAREAAGPSPFGVRRPAPEPVTEVDTPGLAAYNRMLARLAAQDAEN